MFKEKIGEAAVYEQLAEEAAELAQAALKVARILRGENPTPVSLEEARENAVEEFTDICVAANDLGIKADYRVFESKTNRWKMRLDETVKVANKTASQMSSLREGLKSMSREAQNMRQNLIRQLEIEEYGHISQP